jgi:hypothetical protein
MSKASHRSFLQLVAFFFQQFVEIDTPLFSDVSKSVGVWRCALGMVTDSSLKPPSPVLSPDPRSHHDLSIDTATGPDSSDLGILEHGS